MRSTCDNSQSLLQGTWILWPAADGWGRNLELRLSICFWCLLVPARLCHGKGNDQALRPPSLDNTNGSDPAQLFRSGVMDSSKYYKLDLFFSSSCFLIVWVSWIRFTNSRSYWAAVKHLSNHRGKVNAGFHWWTGSNGEWVQRCLKRKYPIHDILKQVMATNYCYYRKPVLLAIKYLHGRRQLMLVPMGSQDRLKQTVLDSERCASLAKWK